MLWGVVPRQDLAHGLDQLRLRHRELRLGLLLQIVVAILGQPGDLGAEDQVLDLHLALRLLVGALDHHARRPAFVGIFHLRTELARPEIKLGADASGAQARHHALIIGEPPLIEDRHHHRAGLRLAVELAREGQRGLEARDAYRESGRRYRLAAKARDEPVVAAAARDRADAHRPPLLVAQVAGEVRLVDRAGVVFETAHDRRIDDDAAVIAARAHQRGDRLELVDAGDPARPELDPLAEQPQRLLVALPARGQQRIGLITLLGRMAVPDEAKHII